MSHCTKRIDAVAEAVRRSHSVAEVLRHFGLRVAGGNYATIQGIVKAMQLDTSHWTGQAHRRGSHVPVVKARPLRDVLVMGSRYKSSTLRQRLIAEGVFAAKCSSCAHSEWMGRKIALELDHIDGDRDNNSLSNLRLLCPNCHAMTETYRGRNVPRRARELGRVGRMRFEEASNDARVVKSVDTGDLQHVSPRGEMLEV